MPIEKTQKMAEQVRDMTSVEAEPIKQGKWLPTGSDDKKLCEVPKEKITYGAICEQQPEPSVFFKTFSEAVNWAENDQPAHRPYFIVERTEHFEVCGVVKAKGDADDQP